MKKIEYNQTFHMLCDAYEILKLLDEFLEYYHFEPVIKQKVIYLITKIL